MWKKKNRRDDRNPKSIYRTIYSERIIDDNLPINLMTTSFCGRFDKDVYDIGRRYCSPTVVSTTEMKNLYWLAIPLSVLVNFIVRTMRIIELIWSDWMTDVLNGILDAGTKERYLHLIFQTKIKINHQMIVIRYMFSSDTINIMKWIRILKRFRLPADISAVSIDEIIMNIFGIYSDEVYKKSNSDHSSYHSIKSSKSL